MGTRVTRKFLPNLTGNAPRPEGGTSDRMLRIARHHVYAVVKGKSVDEIISEYLRNRQKIIKPQGYVGIEEYNNEKKVETVTNKKNQMQHKNNTVESLERNKLVYLDKSKVGSESRIDRIRKVINFGDDNR
ncbi:hypothetical protein NQ314_012858 [Rhamnusium bicolor]|uniref:Uncharacterized protein n=1 Tax=Rhamnusium bicolor TaxID=1586634 RepID=A0AAV8X9G7_9CUCU|nr:hypothetical protein NQ314_012858 [Rhamnusium bicolor]